jgi:hypothetical protein
VITMTPTERDSTADSMPAGQTDQVSQATQHEQDADLPPQNRVQRLLSSVAYQGPEILAGLLVVLIGCLLWWPATWLGLACVVFALITATVRHISEQRLTDRTSPDHTPPAPAPADEPAPTRPKPTRWDRPNDHLLRRPSRGAARRRR